MELKFDDNKAIKQKCSGLIASTGMISALTFRECYLWWFNNEFVITRSQPTQLCSGHLCLNQGLIV